MTVRIGDTEPTGRRRGPAEDTTPDAMDDRQYETGPTPFRKHRHPWWYQLEFGLPKSRA
jgi:hypothetical protein